MTVEIPASFVQQRRKSINSVLDQLEISGLLTLNGTGVDLGCYVGTSCGALESRGLSVTYVEDDERFIQQVRDMGYSVVHSEAIDFISAIGAIDFVTFFGAPADFNVESLLREASNKLNRGGGILVTGYPNIEPSINRAIRLAGQKIQFRNVHGWDSVGFVYST